MIQAVNPTVQSSSCWATATAPFTLAGSAPIGTDGAGLLLADFNNDGRLDAAATNYGGNTISILVQAAPPWPNLISVNGTLSCSGYSVTMTGSGIPTGTVSAYINATLTVTPTQGGGAKTFYGSLAVSAKDSSGDFVLQTSGPLPSDIPSGTDTYLGMATLIVNGQTYNRISMTLSPATLMCQ